MDSSEQSHIREDKDEKSEVSFKKMIRETTLSSDRGELETSSKEIKLRDKMHLARERWMTNSLDLEDKLLQKVVNEIRKTLPEKPTLAQLSSAVRAYNVKSLANLSENIQIASELLDKNRYPLLQRFQKGEYPLLGEFLDPEKPANVCQQNVLLLSSLAASYDFLVKVAGFEYVGKQSGDNIIHAVAVFQPHEGEEVIMDPTLLVQSYGDVTHLNKSEYLARFKSPDLSTPQEVFVPNE